MDYVKILELMKKNNDSPEQVLALEKAITCVKHYTSGTYECFHCGSNGVVWQSDFDFSDYGLEGEGVVHICTCTNCGADIEYYCGGKDDNNAED